MAEKILCLFAVAVISLAIGAHVIGPFFRDSSVGPGSVFYVDSVSVDELVEVACYKNGEG